MKKKDRKRTTGRKTPPPPNWTFPNPEASPLPDLDYSSYHFWRDRSTPFFFDGTAGNKEENAQVATNKSPKEKKNKTNQCGRTSKHITHPVRNKNYNNNKKQKDETIDTTSATKKEKKEETIHAASAKTLFTSDLLRTSKRTPQCNDTPPSSFLYTNIPPILPLPIKIFTPLGPTLPLLV